MKTAFTIFKTLSDETRLLIALKLFKKGEMSCKQVSESFKDLSQPTISHHFKALEKAGIISVRKEGTSHFYSLNKEILKKNGVDLSLVK
ncbi:MAG TPA: metalloregulator ArsR/SmtB family transcription factor [Candidatus Paceibacterota bacterium]|jgi:ArsR family transcriptional regulator|nr:metalloregulator ArsR/SmtB family transcription factor [Candidatus Paceibacterota bacterium]